MARIRSKPARGLLRVTVIGRLTMVDMGRLERACSPALTSHPPKLEIDLRGVTHTDSTARAVLERMSQYGARITNTIADRKSAGDPEHAARL